MRPRSLRFEASTICQLKCPLCPNSQGQIAQTLGAGFLKIERFKELIDQNPWIDRIELSNYGEIFLNPDIYAIIEYAYKKNLLLTAWNGSNFDRIEERVLEGLVKYRFLAITCSIDGTSQEIYGRYRVGGDYRRVIKNIETLNFYKKKYRSPFPLIKWQFVLFGHNQHQISAAKELARKLGMNFQTKLNFDEAYSPVDRNDMKTKEKSLDIVSLGDHLKATGEPYLQKEMCRELWTNPQINWDGRILGCCCNYWGDFGNIYETGLEKGLDGEAMQTAKLMLQGRTPAKAGIPCTTCHAYLYMRTHNRWLTPDDVRDNKLHNFIFRSFRKIGWARVEPFMRLIPRKAYGLMSKLI